jgi:hypothetical protein
MIARGEIEEKSREFGIHIANVQRDYVFGLVAYRQLLRYSARRRSGAQRGQRFS